MKEETLGERKREERREEKLLRERALERTKVIKKVATRKENPRFFQKQAKKSLLAPYFSPRNTPARGNQYALAS